MHPPTYYGLLYVWSYFNPGMSEYHWAQEFSVFLGLIFIWLVWLGLTHAFGRAGAWAVPFFALATTYLHYGTEVRMYMLLLVFSVVVFNAVVRSFEKMWLLYAGFALCLLPMTHYFAAMAVVVFAFISYVWLKRKGETLKLMIFPFSMGLIGIILAVDIALDQRARVFGTWFQPPSVSSWPSAALYNVFMLEQNDAPVALFLAIYFAFLVLLVFLALKAYKMMSARERSDEDVLLLLMGATVILPLLGLVAAPLLGGEGFAHLYHHRFFLVTGWMFTAAVFVMLGKWRFGGGAWYKYLTVLLVQVALVFMVVTYAASAHHELENVLKAAPCDGEKITIIHESPFSALPANVYAREHGCSWRNVVSTKMTKEMANGAGFDVMNQSDVYWNLTLPKGDYYMVYAAGTIPVDGLMTTIEEEDGVELRYVIRWKEEADSSNMTWWVNNLWYDPDLEFVRIGNVPEGGCCYPKNCVQPRAGAYVPNCTCVYAVWCGEFGEGSVRS